MNASAIYSKSGKGVQEAAGKTSHLSRSDRAVLSAIDGRATLADVAQKVGKAFDPAFEKLIEALDKGGFIREVSGGAPGAAPRPAAGAKPAAKATGPMDVASDLDFTTALSIPKGRASPPPQPPPKAAPPSAKHTATIPPPPPPPSAAEKAQAKKSAQEQEDAFAKAREEAERKAAADRERVKAEAEATMRAETEARLRAETEARLKAEAEAKVKAEAEAKVKAAREAAAKATAAAKAKAEAEAKKAREEAERARKEAEEIAERVRKEAEEKARREQEELKRKLEEERRKLEEERKRHEEERRREEEERTLRRIQEERERVARRKQEQEEERREQAGRKRREEEQEEVQEEDKPRPKQKEPEPAPAKAAGGGGFSDTLLADLESFTTREEEDQKANEEAARKESEAAAARAREAEERRAKEAAERQEREAKAQRKREEAERKAQEEAELREREEREKQRLEEEEEKRKLEAEEREKKAKQDERLAARAERGPAAYSEEAQLRSRRERELAAKPRRAAGARAERRGWGKPFALTLFLLLVVAVAVAHVMPIDASEYERAATDALGRPVRIGSANLSLVTGLQLKFSDVNLGDGIRIPVVRAYPEFDALLGPRKAFSRIEVERMKIDPNAAGQVLFAKVRSDTFGVGRVVAKNIEFTGPLALPKGLEFELVYDAEGAVRAAVVRGPEALVARLTSKGQAFDVEMSASSFTLPFAPEISLSKFALKGAATPQGLSVSEWDGALLNGTLSGTANVRWGETWMIDGVVTARNLYAAVFAPALLSDGKAEGSGKFSMRGPPGKLASSTRIDGSFTVTRGVLGSIDLSRAIQTGGKFATGRTEFSEMNGQGTYDRGAVSLRNVTIGAGQLNAGATADIAQNGALSGRIVADVRVASQTLRATLNLGGTVKEPQVRN